jgi:hypothetical protein
MRIKGGLWVGKTIPVGIGNKKHINISLFSFKIETKYPSMLNFSILCMKKEVKSAKVTLQFSVERVSSHYYLFNNSISYHTHSAFYLLNYVKSVVQFYLGIKVVLY